jgi:hypothetical protein
MTVLFEKIQEVAHEFILFLFLGTGTNSKAALPGLSGDGFSFDF